MTRKSFRSPGKAGSTGDRRTVDVAVRPSHHGARGSVSTVGLRTEFVDDLRIQFRSDSLATTLRSRNNRSSPYATEERSAVHFSLRAFDQQTGDITFGIVVAHKKRVQQSKFPRRRNRSNLPPFGVELPSAGSWAVP